MRLRSRLTMAGAAAWLALALAFVAPQAHARAAPDTFADLAEKLSPSVVNISTTQKIEGGAGVEPPTLPPGSPYEEFFKEFLEKNKPRQNRKGTSLGSGFIWSSDGLVVTNNHVIQDADEISVILQDETRLPAQIVGRDSKTDLAVLRVDAKGRALPAVEFGDSDAIRVGDWVLAIGNPFGFGGTVTAGIISARGRDINAGPYDDFLQTDAPINRGNSGGPLFNLNGKVIGISTAIYSPSGGSIGIGFAIPSNGALAVIRQLVEHGEVRRGWLGVRIQSVNEDIADALGLKEPVGALVAGVIPGGPAEKAKIKDGDVILEFDGKPITQMRRLPRLVAETPVGRTVPVRLWRDGRETKVTVEVAALREEDEKVASAGGAEKAPEGLRIDLLGLSVAAIDERARERWDIDSERSGVVIVKVDADSAAEEQGLKVGDVIVEVGRDDAGTPAAIAEKVKAAKESGRKSVLMLVDGSSGLRYVALRLAKN